MNSINKVYKQKLQLKSEESKKALNLQHCLHINPVLFPKKNGPGIYQKNTEEKPQFPAKYGQYLHERMSHIGLG